MTESTRESTRDRLVSAAYDLFDERGYDATTVEAVAERAGVGRTTFFRAFRSKDDVVLPDHAAVLARVAARLDAVAATAPPAAVATGVVEAAHLVLAHYLAEGDRARARYRLTRTVPALRQREVAGLQAYQRLFREFFRGRVGDGEAGEVRAEVLAAGVVTAHNHVLRRWLRTEEVGSSETTAALDRALADVLRLFAPAPGGGARVVVLEADGDVDDVVREVRAALEP
ncbi:TetR/AcrR family transcriptional regulator [uncultured Nocardioides sp.]|uniref:TetR/AcrR family transcriptional regulator n=1 Tax=uncultured Nocardioides sp. TaxID=198441 RepID=UPI0026153ECD|nr:TetR/AcrR family transcriptional regulator [uncultured Nocardioides sp.]